MNTFDIRDMDSKQTLYWSISVPVTVGVLASAYVCAYKWEDISMRVSKAWENKARIGARGGSGWRDWRAL